MDRNRVREMDLNLYLGLPSLGREDTGGDLTDRGDSGDLPQNAEVAFEVPVRSRQHWSTNRIPRLETSNITTVDLLPESTGPHSGGNDYDVSELVLMHPQRAMGNRDTPLERAGESIKLQCSSGEHEKVQKPGQNFECNVCFEFAKEPVVTSCGHLFCWPCLYQWLYVHSNTKECPVCKGLVTDSNIIPIYGRGDGDPDKTCGGESSSCLKPPPRPHGLRFESLRQRMLMSRIPEYGSYPLDEILNGFHSQHTTVGGQGIGRSQRRARTLRRSSVQGWWSPPYERTRLPARRSRVRTATAQREHAHSQDAGNGS